MLKNKQRKKVVKQKKMSTLKIKRSFINRIEYICLLSTSENVFALLPKVELEKIYLKRMLPIKFVCSVSKNNPIVLWKNVKKLTEAYMKTSYVPLVKDGTKIFYY